MSEGIGQIKGSISGTAETGGFDSIVNELSSLIGSPGSSVTINMESGTSSDACSDVSEILRRIDILR